jgi:hypothetical protein
MRLESRRGRAATFVSPREFPAASLRLQAVTYPYAVFSHIGLALMASMAVSHSQPASGTKSRQPAYVRTGEMPAPEANQAAAADDRFVYAIDSAVVAKYDRATGKRLAVSTGSATHLNSGFLWEGKLYCAHSNYPRKPERSEIMVLNPETMILKPFEEFGDSRGSLTWVVREGADWWCNFAYYGDDNAKTTLVKLNTDWREQGAWTYPPEVVKDLGRMSISGGLWKDGLLLATGHDHRKIYRLRLPKQGTVLELVDVLPSPFPGQGIAVDAKTGGLIGIDRAKRQIVFAILRAN